MAAEGLRIEPASPALGSVVRGVDLTAPLDDATWSTIRDAMRRTYLLVFPEQQAIDVAAPGGQSAVRVRLGRLDERYPHHVRPVLWPHRDDGREVLGVWEQHTDAILPLEPETSDTLIEELYAHLYRSVHTHVHRWSPGDLVVWDNHALQHGRPDVGTAELRTLRRVAIGSAQDLSIFAAYRGSRDTPP